MNNGIAGTMARILYCEGAWGIANASYTQQYFTELSSNTIGFIGAVLYHAIHEYQDDGSRITVQFMGHMVECMYQEVCYTPS